MRTNVLSTLRRPGPATLAVSLSLSLLVATAGLTRVAFAQDPGPPPAPPTTPPTTPAPGAAPPADAGAGSAAEPDRYDAQKNMERGSDAMARGDFKAAVVFFRTAKELKPDATGPLLALGLALRANGECQEAIVHLEDYLKRKPDGNPKAKEALDYCKAEIEKQKKLAEARLKAQQPPETPQQPTEPPPPVYRRWWFWTLLGVVVAGGAVAAGVLATSGNRAPAAGIGGTGPAQPAFMGLVLGR